MSDTPETTGSATVMIVPGKAYPVTVRSDTTVADALRQAGVSSDGYQIRIDGEQVDLDSPVENGERVVLSKQIKGN